MRCYIVPYLYQHLDWGRFKSWNVSSNQQNKNRLGARQRIFLCPCIEKRSHPQKLREGKYLFLEKNSFLEGNSDYVVPSLQVGWVVVKGQ